MDELEKLALVLHFSAAPAVLALELLQKARRESWFSPRQVTRTEWHQAYGLAAGSVGSAALLPELSWEQWRRSLPKALELSTSCSLDPGDRLLLYGSPCYPSPLYRLYRPPFALFARSKYFRGDSRDANFTPGFALCGSRKATLQGCSDAYSLAYGVCRHHKFQLVSGLTEGIELAACKGALRARDGAITAVLCCGLNALAPDESQEMAQHIWASGGLLLSEYPHSQPRQCYTFLQRNRILAALASSLVMVELGPKTKAINLVHYALELHHDVAVLGHSEGVCRLQKQGCAHWNNAAELLKALGIHLQLGRDLHLWERTGPSQQLGELIARQVRSELQHQSHSYLGRRICEYPS